MLTHSSTLNTNGPHVTFSKITLLSIKRKQLVAKEAQAGEALDRDITGARAIAEYEQARAQLWELDDRIMAIAAADIAELAIKAEIVRYRTDEDGPHGPYVSRLVADVLEAAS